MRIDPTLARLPRDPAPVVAQSAAMNAVLDTWRNGPGGALLADLVRHGEGARLDTLPVLAKLMDGNAAVLQTLFAALCEALAGAPLGQPELPASLGRGSMALTLAVAGRSMLTFVLGEPTPMGEQPLCSASFGDGEVAIAVLAGKAEGEIVARPQPGVAPSRQHCRLAPGFVRHMSLDQEALNLVRIESPLAMVRLHRATPAPEVEQQFDLTTGDLVAQSAADPRESRMELAMTLLERMGRADAAPVLADLARAGSLSRRWQALRHALALDTATGFAALMNVAADDADPLAVDARQLADSLTAQYPALARLKKDMLCPA